jgi:hypothetical protein
MKAPRAKNRWSAVRKRLETFDRTGLLNLIADLYEASAENRRFLESRLLSDTGVIEQYRRTIIPAIYPDPLSRRPISVREASAAITHYRRATGDPLGTADLMSSFVEAGTEQSVDLGYGDDGYFAALERKLDAIDHATSSPEPRATSRAKHRMGIRGLRGRRCWAHRASRRRGRNTARWSPHRMSDQNQVLARTAGGALRRPRFCPALINPTRIANS